MSEAAVASRTALVTGASSGIGAAVARAFGALGWSVALGARRVDLLKQVAEEVAEGGGRASVHPLDVSRPESLDRCFDAAQDELGALDVVVSNAGVCRPGLLHEVPPEDIEAEIATNLLGPMLLSRRAVAAWHERGSRGDLVFISSENVVAPRPFQAGYTATKWAVEGLARVLRMELEGTGIRAIVVRPGPTGTEFGRSWEPELIRRLLRSWKHWGLQRHMQWLPAESVAHAVVAAVTAPPGTHMDVIEVMPEGPEPG